MSRARIHAAVAPLCGALTLPGDKSLSHRHALLSLLTARPVELRNFGSGADCQSTLACLRCLGKTVSQLGSTVVLTGLANWSSGELDCGNSGTTARLLMGLLAGREGEWTLTGDSSLSRRPMERVAVPLRQMGAQIELTNGHLPARIVGRPLRGIEYDSPIASAQVKSAVLLAARSAMGISRYREPMATRDHTERLLGISPSADGWIELDPQAPPLWEELLSGEIPGDPSAASFWIEAALLVPESEITIERVLANPRRLGLMRLLQEAGAEVTIFPGRDTGAEETARICVRYSKVRAVQVSGSLTAELIDELPALGVAATAFRGQSTIRDASELRVKESDRLSRMTSGLQAMGAVIMDYVDGLDIIGPTPLHGAEIETDGDHRIAMAFAVGALNAEGETVIQDAECVSVSYPAFWSELKRLASSSVIWED